MFDCPDAKAQARPGLRMTHGPPLDNHQAAARPGKFIKTSLHSGQAGGQNSWETKFHKRVRQSGQMIGLHGHDHESLFGTLGSLIGPLEAPQNDQKPLKMAISGTFKHPSQT